MVVSTVKFAENHIGKCLKVKQVHVSIIYSKYKTTQSEGEFQSNQFIFFKLIRETENYKRMKLRMGTRITLEVTCGQATLFCLSGYKK